VCIIHAAESSDSIWPVVVKFAIKISLISPLTFFSISLFIASKKYDPETCGIEKQHILTVKQE